MIDLAKTTQYSKSLLAFCLDIELSFGRFGDRNFTEQIQLLTIIERMAIALSRGEVAAVRRLYAECTKGFAKTSLLAMVVVWLLLFSPHALLIVVVARDFGQGCEIIKVVNEIVRHNPAIESAFDVLRDQIVNRSTGTNVDIWTRDSLGGHGGRPSLTIVDECSHIDDPDLVDTALFNATKLAHGQIILAGNAGFFDTPAFSLREFYRTTDGYEFFQYARPAPHLNETDLREVEARNPVAYRRLYWGETTSGNAQSFPPQDLNAAFSDPSMKPAQVRDSSMVYVCAGLDLGVRKDASGFSVFCADREGSVRQSYHQMWQPRPGQPVDLRELQETVFYWCKQLQVDLLLADPWQTYSLIQDAAAAGIPSNVMPFTGPNLNKMAVTMTAWLAERRLKMYSADMRRSFESLRVQDVGFGGMRIRPTTVRESAGVQTHSDLAVSACLACIGLNELLKIKPGRWNSTSDEWIEQTVMESAGLDHIAYGRY